MKINSITLNNIGPYVGEHVFDLSTTEGKNVILIGGKNGAGKTTFLKAIKLGLFGCHSLGLKNETAIYWKEIDEILNNNCKGPFFISIELEYIESFITKKISIKRQWIKVPGQIKEEANVFSEGNKLSDFEAYESLEKIKSLTSPQLINSYIYDGEKIASAINNDTISSYLEETFSSIFGINLLDQSIKDISNYLAKLDSESETKNFQENIVIINKINSLKGEIKSIDQSVASLKRKRADIVSIRKSNIDEFLKLGGLTKAQFQDLQIQLSKTEKKKEELSREIKGFVESDLPLFLCRELLGKAVVQVEKEQGYEHIKHLEDIEHILDVDLKGLIAKVFERFGDCNPIHNLSYEQSTELTKRLKALDKNIDKVKKVLSKKVAKQDEYKMLRQAIQRNEDIDKVDHIISEIESNDNAIKNLQIEIDKAEETLDDKKKELELNYKIFEKLCEDVRKHNAENSSAVLASNSIATLEKAREAISNRKREQISSIAISVFNATIGKKNYLTRIVINKDFSLEVFNSFGKKISPKILSAGEIQILVSSLIWAIFKASGRREMFVFDTPLARLDISNRKSFISNIVLTISQQVVILSTDSEIVGENLNLVRDKTSHMYLLNYDDKKSETRVVKGYFGGEEK